MQVTNKDRRNAVERLGNLPDGGVGPTSIYKALFGTSWPNVAEADETRNLLKLMAMIEPQLPDGVEWPRFEDGELVRFGDEVAAPDDVVSSMRSEFIAFDGQKFKLVDHDGWDITNGWCAGSISRPAPLDANDEPVMVGDTVWLDLDKLKGTVISLDRDGAAEVDFEDGTAGLCDSVTLTHIEPEPPDSWERLIGDAVAADDEGSRGMCEALVLRAKVLAGDGE